MNTPRSGMDVGASRTNRLACVCSRTLALLSGLTLLGCHTVAPISTAPPSALEQTVAAMERGDWDAADRLIEPILPPISRDDATPRNVARGE